eukprot:jgi/Botrbrau1/20421/Bobra.0006s0075.2
MMARCTVAPTWSVPWVTLGTPHLSLEQYPFGRVPERWNANFGPAQTRGSSLRYCNFFYPTAAYHSGVRIVSVAGEAVEGRRLRFRKLQKPLWRRNGQPGALEENIAFIAYEAACGKGATVGDGICPTETALLPGAAHRVLQGVYHSPSQGRPCLETWSAFACGMCIFPDSPRPPSGYSITLTGADQERARVVSEKDIQD